MVSGFYIMSRFSQDFEKNFLSYQNDGGLACRAHHDGYRLFHNLISQSPLTSLFYHVCPDDQAIDHLRGGQVFLDLEDVDGVDP